MLTTGNSGMLSVSCATCYVKGTVYATLKFDKDFNLTAAFSQFISQFGGQVESVAEQVWNEFENWADYVYENSTGTALNDIENAVTFQCTFPYFNPSSQSPTTHALHRWHWGFCTCRSH